MGRCPWLAARSCTLSAQGRLYPLPSRIVRFMLMLVLSWCVMTCTHELGHIAAGWSSGGTLRNADLRPWHLPYSIFDPDPHPLVTLWGGPVCGVILPLGIALAVRRQWLFFIAFFCVLANGTYLATAWLAGGNKEFLDTPQLLAHGAHPATVAVYCVVTIGVGYIGFRQHCMRMLRPTAGGTALPAQGKSAANAGAMKAVGAPTQVGETAAPKTKPESCRPPV